MSDRVVCVEWEDAESLPQWIDREQVKKLKAPIVKSYGVIVRRDKRVLVLAHAVGGDELGVDVIPAGMVKRVRRLT